MYYEGEFATLSQRFAAKIVSDGDSSAYYKRQGVSLMNYDEMILDCKGDCENCEVTLECQYQTSDGEEKQKYLKLLEERDQRAAEELNETCANNYTAEKEASENEVTDLAEAAISGDTNDIATETESAEGEEAEAETVNLSDEEIKEIYNSVFGLDGMDACEIQEETETIKENAEETESEAESVAETEKPEMIAEEKEELSCQIEVTPATKEVIDKIFAEVFGLCETAETEPETQTEEVLETDNEAPVQTCEELLAKETVTETVAEPEIVKETQAETSEPATETNEPTAEPAAETSEADTQAAEGEAEEAEPTGKVTFKLVPPENNEELMALMCAKRARKLIYRPNETLISATFKVLGTDKKNEVGEKIKDVIDAEIKQGVKVGYLDKFDGLSSSEIKEEYENDIVYEYADQEFKKTGVIYDGKKIKVYIYDWDGKACHHVGYIDETEATEFIPYFIDKESYSFDVCGIITGGKGKRVTKVGDTLKIIKEKGDPIGIDVDIAIIKRKD